MLVWLAMLTGARRGELCALRWDCVDFTTGVLQIRTSIAQQGATTWEKDTKTHQQRRITLDPQTLASLRTYHARRVELAAAVGVELPSDARIFSPVPDGSEWVKPDTVGQRYTRMCARLGWDMHLHQLRHYSATELIAAGVDVRTVAGRLGHSGGGTTTLKVYSAWRSEAVQRAASSLGLRMPALPIGVDPAAPLAGPSLTDGLVEAHPLGRSRRLELGSRLARAAGGRDAEAVCAATWTFPPGDGVRSARQRGRPRCRCLSASRAGVAVAVGATR
jgi:integrase